MFVNKIGKDHSDYGKNCEDYGLENNKLKLVCDGCGESLHSEVGAKSYCHLIKYHENDDTFEMLLGLYGQDAKSIKDYLCFTIVGVLNNEEENLFLSFNCGDGFVILQDKDGNITFEELTDGEYPKYYAYNYVDKSTLKQYQDGVDFEFKTYSKEEYQNVGVASDGIRFILKESEELQEEFKNILKSGSEVKMKRFINKHQDIFRDDVTIVF